ncbi:MAG: hypothetical protein KBC44_00385 [Candidatus Pacebacteria bacterium]|nr:hypothetical protein [Candidatus Paceibacterota bacterium]MDQ5922548.1 hypothetical protein [Patescibacteria group bacterium]
MGIFSNFKKEGQLALVFDVGSSSVGGALFRLEKEGSPKIIYSYREPIVLEEKISSSRLLFLTIKSLKSVASNIASSGKGAPHKVFCVLSSPWFASQTRIIKLEKNTPFVFTTKLADSLLEKEMNLFKEEHLKKYEGTDEELRPIEFKNMKTVLNGYPTHSPINQKAHELEMSVFISMASSLILDKIEEVVFKYFHEREVKFSSFMMTSFAVARDVFVNQDNFLLVNIGGEMTDISMIKKDTLNESISFPLGRNFIIRGVAEKMGIPLVDAQAYLSLYKDEHADPTTKAKLDPIVGKLKKEWVDKFQIALANISTDISIPATIFITVDSYLTEFFSEIIKTEQFNQYTLTESKFRVVFLGTQALHGIAMFENDATRDPFLIIESIYINRFLN